MKVTKPMPCYCNVCDAPDALLVTATHEKPGYDHIKLRWALCDKHAGQLASALLLFTRTRRALTPGGDSNTATD